jgi:PAS domain S-box-containing protein
VPGALAVVILSTAGKRLDSGTIGVIYFEALSTSVILGGVLIYLLYALMQQPLHLVNTEIDKALRGDLDELNKKYQNEEVNLLIDAVNSLLSRIPKTANEGGAVADVAAGGDQTSGENLLKSIAALSAKIKTPMTLLDAEFKVRQMNSAFEEVTGMRGADAVGQPIETIARDESFPAVLRDLSEKAKAELEGAVEDYEFPNGMFKVTAYSLMTVQGRPDGTLYIMEKAE